MAHTDACKIQTTEFVEKLVRGGMSVERACEETERESDGIPARTIHEWWKQIKLGMIRKQREITPSKNHPYPEDNNSTILENTDKKLPGGYGTAEAYKLVPIDTPSPHFRTVNTGENEWYTPAQYIKLAREVLGTIDFDPASSDQAQERVKASRYYTKEDNGIEKSWGGAWLNKSCSCHNNLNPLWLNNDDDEKMHKMLKGITEDIRMLLEQEPKRETVFFLVVQRLSTDSEQKSNEKKEGESGNGDNCKREQDSLCAKPQGCAAQKAILADPQQHTQAENASQRLLVELGTLGAEQARLGREVCVLRQGDVFSAGSLYTAITSRLSGNCALEYAASLQFLQFFKGGDSSNGVVKGQASICPNCGLSGLSLSSRVFANPPYSTPLLSQFINKLIAEVDQGRVTEAIVLTHNYTDTAWFHLAESRATSICFTRGRIRFEDQNGNLASPTQGQAFFYYGRNAGRFAKVFKDVGFIR
jgi:hypothetical protein